MILIRSKAGEWEEKTSQIVTMERTSDEVRVRFSNSETSYRYGPARVRELSRASTTTVPASSRVRVNGELWQRPEGDLVVTDFERGNDAWRRVSCRKPDGWKHYSYPAAAVVIVESADRSATASEVMGYWRSIVAHLEAHPGKSGKPDAIVDTFKHLDFVHHECALAALIEGTAPVRRSFDRPLVFPFSCNLSQRDAVKQALTSSISVIKGPPGTGKTQTILNLIANIVTADLGTVGVVSFSNSAVDNVEEKLEARGFGDIVGQLGNKDKAERFLERLRHAASTTQPQRPDVQAPSPGELEKAGLALDDALKAERKLAELRLELDALRVEHSHFVSYKDRHSIQDLGDFPLLRRSSSRILSYLAETQIDETVGRPGFVRRVQRYFRYGSTRGLDARDSDVLLALQATFYERRLEELEAEVHATELAVTGHGIPELLQRLQQISIAALSVAIAKRRSDATAPLRDGKIPWKTDDFANFCKTYPVLTSTCHSLIKRLPSGHLLDYLIIDEASQVDLLSAAAAMACCKNLVIVGDQKQLGHIAASIPNELTAPKPEYDYVSHSVLTAVSELYGDEVPTTLLQEHYRCHPAIIGYCNTAFYNDELIPYTQYTDSDGPAMWIHRTVAGDHMRVHRSAGGGRSNQRELDVVRDEVIAAAPAGVRPEEIVVATPYRKQVEKATAQLVDEIDFADTVHKLQGREKRMVILSTVLSDNQAGRSGLKFVDDPRLVNVAVSRARDYFVLVTNNGKLQHSRYLKDLIGYIEYRYADQQPEPSNIVSVFDLLYREYDKVLQPLKDKLTHDQSGSPAEHIIEAALAEIVAETDFEHLRIQREVALRNLVLNWDDLSDPERRFTKTRAAMDFVIYNKISKRPVLAIEVDGFTYHEDNPLQLERDAVKDSVLAKAKIRLLRLATAGPAEIGRTEVARIREELRSAESALNLD